jgi:high-affinity iron transporter
MFSSFMITLREGIEGFLVVAITLAYLRKTGRAHLAVAVYAGVAIALLASWGASLVFARADNQPLWEGILALVTAVLVVTFTVHVLRTAKVMKRTIEGHLEEAAGHRGAWAFVGVFAFTVLMITREGMEAALLLSSTFIQTETRPFFLGAVFGLIVAGVLALLWGRYGHRVNLPRFLQVTAVFLLLFVVQLLIYGFHELTEAGVLPIDNGYWHIVTEPYGPEGAYGQWLSYGLVLIPLGWLVWTTLRRPAAASAAPAGTR